jgi:hypothetical protein
MEVLELQIQDKVVVRLQIHQQELGIKVDRELSSSDI